MRLLRVHFSFVAMTDWHARRTRDSARPLHNGHICCLPVFIPPISSIVRRIRASSNLSLRVLKMYHVFIKNYRLNYAPFSYYLYKNYIYISFFFTYIYCLVEMHIAQVWPLINTKQIFHLTHLHIEYIALQSPIGVKHICNLYRQSGTRTKAVCTESEFHKLTGTLDRVINSIGNQWKNWWSVFRRSDTIGYHFNVSGHFV